MRVKGKSLFFLIVVPCLFLTTNLKAFDKVIIFDFQIYYNSLILNELDTIYVSGINNSMLQISGVREFNSDSIFYLDVYGDSSFNLLDDYSYLQFEFHSGQDLCSSTNIDYNIDSSRSSNDTLYLSNFDIRNHFFDYIPIEVCQNLEIIIPSTDIPLENLQLSSLDSIFFDKSWNIHPNLSLPGVHPIQIKSDYCLNSFHDTLFIKEIFNESINIPDTLKYCSNSITLFEDFADFTISPENQIDSLKPEQFMSGYYYFNSGEGNCAGSDSAYIEIIEPKSVEIFSTENCMDASIQFETTAQDFDFVWWNNDTKEQTHTDKSEIVWIEITDENNCKAKDSIEITLNPLLIESLNYSVVNANCWEDGKLSTSDVQINKLEASYLPSLRNKVTGNVILDFEHIPEGIYSYQITDSKGCKAEHETEILIVQKCLTDYPVFTPDNDGVDDEYFIPHEGNVKIFDRNGLILRTIETPNYWDGRDDSGNLLPMGNYIMLTNTNRAINITIVR